ncbi:MAG: potassium channel family protein [Kastovskya adunca ATA6-11-RM4]|jgi:hypothetical protein|nr:potassium channel family protein [Kastovskya adunca ATA6-11-RM4]
MTLGSVILGLLILLVVAIDVLVTTLTVGGGGGPLTSRVSKGLWEVALRIHRQRSSHRLLLVTSWIIVTQTALLWFGLTWVGWVLLFSATESAVVKATTQQPAGIVERIYFVGYTLSTLGLGDYQPQGVVWQIATAVAAANGFFLVTLAIAYLLPVVSAATQKRQLAVYISSLGGTAEDILIRAWNGKDFGQFDQHLINLTSQITLQGESHLAYPILHYFHGIERSRVMVQSFVVLDEALTLLQYGVKEPHQLDPAAVGPLRRSNAAFIKTIRSAYIEAASENPPLPSLEPLRKEGIPTVSDQEFFAATKHLTLRRRLLLALIQNDGWTWDAVASMQTTNRATSLDDETLIDDVVLH